MNQQQKAGLEGRRVALVGNTSFYLYKFRQGTIRELVRRGAKVTCVAVEDEYSERLVRELSASFLSWPLDLDGTNPVRELRSLLSLLKRLNGINPDFVFNFTAKANIYSGISCRLLKLTYANNISGLGLNISTKTTVAGIMRRLYALSNRGAACVCTQNPDDLAYLRSNNLLGDSPVKELAGSGVDLEKFAQQPIPEPPMRFLMIARIQEHKGVREFVEAARIVKRKCEQASFDLVGPTAFTNTSAIPEEDIEPLHGSGSNEWVGSVHNVLPHLVASHAFVLPSTVKACPERCWRPRLVVDRQLSVMFPGVVMQWQTA